MTQTICARCYVHLTRRELLRESLLCTECERTLISGPVCRQPAEGFQAHPKDRRDKTRSRPDSAAD